MCMYCSGLCGCMQWRDLLSSCHLSHPVCYWKNYHMGIEHFMLCPFQHFDLRKANLTGTAQIDKLTLQAGDWQQIKTSIHSLLFAANGIFPVIGNYVDNLHKSETFLKAL